MEERKADVRPAAGRPDERQAGKLQARLAEKDRIIEGLGKAITARDEQVALLGSAIHNFGVRVTLLVEFIQKRDEIIALQSSVAQRIVDVYQPDLVAFVRQEAAESAARIEARVRQAADDAAAAVAENRT